MDIRQFNLYVEGYTLRRQQYINDMLQINHLSAGKIAEAVWGSREFKKPFKEIELLREDSDADAINKKVYGFLKRKGIIK